MKVIKQDSFTKLRKGLIFSVSMEWVEMLYYSFLIVYIIVGTICISVTGDESPLKTETDVKIIRSLTIIITMLSFFSYIMVINGLIDMSDEIHSFKRARTWLAIRVIISGLNIGNESLFSSLTSDAVYESSLLSTVSISVLACFFVSSAAANYLSYRDMLIGFRQVWHTCGGNADIYSKINRMRLKLDITAGILLFASLWVLLSMLEVLPIFPIVNIIMLLCAGAVFVWQMILKISTVRISRQVENTISEISK